MYYQVLEFQLQLVYLLSGEMMGSTDKIFLDIGLNLYLT